MDAQNSDSPDRVPTKVRILVAIASYGTKNDDYLAVLLNEYRNVHYDVDVVVLSEAPKQLGDEVEVLVGLPGSSPRSLPFAHRPLFAQYVNDYDLFIYSEDDTRITGRHISAFIEVSRDLPSDHVAGFIRYEETPSGDRSYSSIHTKYGWDPASLVSFGDGMYAHLSNPHSACYMLTRSHLEQALDSGGFLVDPHTGREDMMVAAATDPYVQCGLTRVIPISRMDEFLIHHLPNKYVGQFGLEQRDFDVQIRALTRPDLDRRRLIEVESTLRTVSWDKHFYEPERPSLATALAGASSVLTVGCGSGDAERAVTPAETHIVGIPLDAVIGASAADRGIEILAPDFDDAIATLDGRLFDRILLLNLVQHLPDPVLILRRLVPFLSAAGQLLIVAPNIQRERLRAAVTRDHRPRPSLRSFAESGVHAVDHRRLRQWMQASGLVARRVHPAADVSSFRTFIDGLVPPWLVMRGTPRAQSRTRVRAAQTAGPA